MNANEKTRLLTPRQRDTSSYDSTRLKSTSFVEDEMSSPKTIGVVRHIQLGGCVGIIIGNVIGAGVFISPRGVLANVGSPGLMLVVFGAMGVMALIQAMCYAELGTMMPKDGGDYVYIREILGPLPAFMVVWCHIMLVVGSANAVISRTGALYLSQAFGLSCHDYLITIGALWIIVSFAAVNSYSARLGNRVQNLFAIAKVSALSIIILSGIINLCRGGTGQLQPDAIWDNTVTSPGLVAVGALGGYFSYKGWELVNALPEEMVNPQRDLPLSIVISLLTITVIYVLTNMAYFTALSPQDVLESSAVAMTFMERGVGRAGAWFVSVAVAMSCMGSINGSFQADTKYVFAAGRYRQFPQLFAMLQIKCLTPTTCMIFVALVTSVYTVIPNAESLYAYSSLAVQLKIMMSIVALLWLRWKEPKLHRPVKVPLPIVIFALSVMATLLILGAVTEPLAIGTGVALFAMGIPIYYIGGSLQTLKSVDRTMTHLTRVTQLALEVVPESLQASPLN